MITRYGVAAPNIIKSDKKSDKAASIVCYHNHFRSISYQTYQTSSDHRELRSTIDLQTTLLKGCITFFKTVAEHENDPLIKAQALACVAEDEARIEEFKNNRPGPAKSTCTVL